jgi:hypothetical protein
MLHKIQVITTIRILQQDRLGRNLDRFNQSRLKASGAPSHHQRPR